MNRKELRKQARQQKKQRKADYYQRKPSGASVTQKGAPSTVAKGKIVKNDGRKSSSNSKNFSSSKIKPHVKNNTGKFSKKQTIEDSEDEEILSDFDEIESVLSDVSSQEFQADQNFSTFEDDPFLSMIDEALESGKLTKDGFIGEDGNLEDEDFDLDNEVDEEESETEDEENEDEDLEEDEDFDMKTDGTEEDEENESVDSEELSEEEMSEEEIPEPQTPPKKFIKPKEKAVEVVMDEASIRLQKQIQSLINKLSSANLISIANEFETLFRNNRRKVVIEILTSLILSAIVKPGGNLLDSFALNFAALSFTVNHLVGIEFGAHLIEKLIEQIDELYEESKKFISATGEETNTFERSLVNCMNFCSFLYDLQVISDNLICDLIKQSAERLDEVDIEIILKLFRTCGTQLKKDDPDFLKVITNQIQQKAALLPANAQNSRFKFMVETLAEMKDSKRKLAASVPSEMEPIKKMLKNMLNQRSIAKIEPLRISLEDVRNIEIKGKWWLIGSSWHPDNIDSGASKESENARQKKDEELRKIEALAKEQRMNTEVRKLVFSTIVTSDDYIDAFERIVGMKLSGRQEREVVLVLLHCCGQEKLFNPFYALLAGKLIEYRHGYMITFQYTLWDSLKQLNEYSLRKLGNIAKMYGILLANGDLKLEVLRRASFIRMSEKEVIFFQILFMTLVTKSKSDEELLEIFRSLSETIANRASSSSADVSGKNKAKKTKGPKILTKNMDMTEFDDDFFAAQENIVDPSKAAISQEKLEELKALKNGLGYFLTVYVIKCEDLPFSGELVDLVKKKSKLIKSAVEL